MNVRDSPLEVMLSSLSPAFSVPGQVEAASAAVLLEAAVLELDEAGPELDPALPELDAELTEPDPEPEEPWAELDAELWPALDPEFDGSLAPPFDPLVPCSAPVLAAGPAWTLEWLEPQPPAPWRNATASAPAAAKRETTCKFFMGPPSS